MKRVLALTMVALSFGVCGCMGPRVEVPTAHVGKVLTTSGFEKGLRQPSTFRLALNLIGNNPQALVLAEASDQQKVEGMTLFMPKDKLNLTFDVRGTYSISNEEERVGQIFGRASPKQTGPYTSTISFDDVYTTYGQQVVWTTCRGILVKYDIEFIMGDRATISAELEREVRARLALTPLTVVNFGLSSVQPPELIVNAQKAAKEREVAIETAKADRAVKLTEANARLEVARKQQMVDLLEADTQRQVGLKLTKGVNPAFVEQRVLSVLESLSASNDKVILVPEAALSNVPMMTAINQSAVDAGKTDKTETSTTPTENK